MTIYRIYQRYAEGDGAWSPVHLGDTGPVAESTDLARIREHFAFLVRGEKAKRREADRAAETSMVVMLPFVPRQYKLVAIPTVDLEVFDAPHPLERAKAAKPDDGHTR